MLEDDSDVAAGSEAWDRLGEFVERDPDVAGAFRFRHALIRDAAYEGLSFKRRRELHGRVAEVIERQQGERTEEVAELLSLHYFNAGRWEEAWTYSRLAGDLARRSTRTSTPRGSTSARIEASAKVDEPRGRRARADVACARRGARRGGQLPRSDRRAESATTLLKDDPVAQAELY